MLAVSALATEVDTPEANSNTAVNTAATAAVESLKFLSIVISSSNPCYGRSSESRPRGLAGALLGLPLPALRSAPRVSLAMPVPLAAGDLQPVFGVVQLLAVLGGDAQLG